MPKFRRTITLVLGGARSGKSRYAQELASKSGRVVFLATLRPLDKEMQSKIAHHRRERPSGWKTVEAPVRLAEAIRSESVHADVLLVDCLTLFVSNVMRTGHQAETHNRRQVRELCDAMRSSSASIIAVSNEVGNGVVPEFRSGRVFRDLLGQLNQEVAAIADNVLLMVAGLPVPLKTARRISGKRG